MESAQDLGVGIKKPSARTDGLQKFPYIETLLRIGCLTAIRLSIRRRILIK